MSVAGGANGEEQIFARIAVIRETASHSTSRRTVFIVIAVSIYDIIGRFRGIISVQYTVSLLYIIRPQFPKVCGCSHPGIRHLRSTELIVLTKISNGCPLHFDSSSCIGKAIFRIYFEIFRRDIYPRFKWVFIAQCVYRLIPISEFEQRPFVQRSGSQVGRSLHILGIPLHAACNQIVRLVTLPYENQMLAGIIVIFHADNSVTVLCRTPGEIHAEVNLAAGFTIYGFSIFRIIL